MIHKIFRIKVGSILKQIKKKTNLSLEKRKHKDIWFKTRYNSKIVGNVKASETC